jgi:peptidoglycan/xylan/chitin deacetylase (PgdA/CDA1 family)
LPLTQFVFHGARGSLKIALTLDDGPNPPFTEKFLQLLAQEQVPATFFLLGRNIEMHRSTAQKIAASSHEIGNHSYSHSALAWKPWKQITEEIEKTDRLIRGLGYKGPIAFRSPFGEKVGWLAWWLWLHARRCFLYDVAPSPPDYFRRAPASIARSTLERTKGGSVLLFHDGEGIRIESLEAAARVIRELKARGFTFVRLSELFPAPN